MSGKTESSADVPSHVAWIKEGWELVRELDLPGNAAEDRALEALHQAAAVRVTDTGRIGDVFFGHDGDVDLLVLQQDARALFALGDDQHPVVAGEHRQQPGNAGQKLDRM